MRRIEWFSENRSSGFTLVEVLAVVAIVILLATYLYLGSGALKSKNDLESVRRQSAALLREAQQRSISGSSSTSWGVIFYNTTTPYIALFPGTFSTASIQTRLALPNTVRFNSTTLPAGASVTYMFSQLVGQPSTSTPIVFEQVSGATPGASATITFSAGGLVGY